MAGLLADYGVTAVFGVPGGQTLPLYYGILDEGNRIRHILMKDEIDATFAADAYARISGGIGVRCHQVYFGLGGGVQHPHPRHRHRF